MGEQLGGTALESTVVNVSAISIIKGLSVYKSFVFISRIILFGKSWRMLEGCDRLSIYVALCVCYHISCYQEYIAAIYLVYTSNEAIPYSGNFSRGLILVVFADECLTTKLVQLYST